jgi:small subunit ribosomal protein S8
MAKNNVKEQNNQKKKGSSMINYPIGDFLIRVKNAVRSQNRLVKVEKSKLILNVAKLLEKEGFFEEVNEDGGQLVIKLAIRRKEPVILDIKLVSSPGLRIYMSVRDLEALKGPSTLIISTPKGVMILKDAIRTRLGGEVIAEIW